MGLFGKQRKVLPELLPPSEYDEVANYNAAMAFLEGLSPQDYAKVLEVANIRRKALQDEAAALGVENEPTTYIILPIDSIKDPATAEKLTKSWLDEPDFLVDDHDTTASKKQRKTAQKATNIARKINVKQ